MNVIKHWDWYMETWSGAHENTLSHDTAINKNILTSFLVIDRKSIRNHEVSSVNIGRLYSHVLRSHEQLLSQPSIVCGKLGTNCDLNLKSDVPKLMAYKLLENIGHFWTTLTRGSLSGHSSSLETSPSPNGHSVSLNFIWYFTNSTSFRLKIKKLEN